MLCRIEKLMDRSGELEATVLEYREINSLTPRAALDAVRGLDAEAFKRGAFEFEMLGEAVALCSPEKVEVTYVVEPLLAANS